MDSNSTKKCIFDRFFLARLGIFMVNLVLGRAFILALVSSGHTLPDLKVQPTNNLLKSSLITAVPPYWSCKNRTTNAFLSKAESKNSAEEKKDETGIG
jgi:hypothetical protein